MAVRSTIDVGRLSAAVARPGIDPRVWLAIAQVTDVAVDLEQGVFADVVFLPEGDEGTCLVGSNYAGDGFGTLVAPKVGDVVLVAVPDGDVGVGPVIISRLFTGTAPPPAEFQSDSGTEPDDATTDPTTVVEPLRTLRIVARDDANIRLEVEGSGKIEIAASGNATVEITGEGAVIVNSPDVRLGTTAGNEVARVGDIVVSSVPALIVGPGPASGSTVIPAPPNVPTATGGTTAVGQITSGAGSVKA